jgi:hypothetical protein
MDRLVAHASELARQIRSSSPGMLDAALEAALLQAFEMIASRAWDEGYSAGQELHLEHRNPYRRGGGTEPAPPEEPRCLASVTASQDAVVTAPPGCDILVNGIVVESPARVRKNDLLAVRAR